MKTTNILLGIIAFLLFLTLIKGSLFNLVPQATAQAKKIPSSSKEDTINVRITYISETARMNIIPSKDWSGTATIPVYVTNRMDNSLLHPVNEAIPVRMIP